MNKIQLQKRIIATVLAVAMVITSLGVVATKTTAATTTYETILSDAISNMVANVVTDPGYGSVGGEWAVFGASRYGYQNDDWYKAYLANVTAAIESKGAAKLSSSKGTENSRVIIALTAIGYDVTNVCGYNLLEPLNDLSFVTKQGINGPIFALIALDTAGYAIPTPTDADSVTTVTTRENLIAYILSKELDGGGFALTGTSADPDITAMALQSLAPYYDTNEDVAAAVDRALEVLSDIQLDNGGYSSWGTENSESTAQVITALSALGIDAATDERFVKNGNTLIDALLAYYDSENAMFMHTLDTGDDQMATEQAIYALVAYYRYAHNLNRIYDMTDAIDLLNTGVTTEATTTESTTQATTTATTTENTTQATTTATVEKPGKVTIKSVKNVSAGVKLTWKKVSKATGYIVYRQKSGASSWTKLKTIKSGSTVTFTDKKAKNGTTYVYKICATNSSGKGKCSATKKICRLTNVTVKSLKKTASKTFALAWKKNAKAAGYQVRYSTSSSMSGAKVKKVSKSKLKKSVTGLKKGKTYYVQVRCYKKVGGKTYYSAWSTKKKVKV